MTDNENSLLSYNMCTVFTKMHIVGQLRYQTPAVAKLPLRCTELDTVSIHCSPSLW